MDNGQLNARAAAIARGRRKADLGLRFVGGPLGCPHWQQPKGALLLRRWSGEFAPAPQVPTVVGFAWRPATTVSSFAGATYANDTIYWHRVEKVSAMGVSATTPRDQVQCAVWGPSGYVGVMPNMPTAIRVVQLAGPKARVLWSYNATGEQVAPARFDVFSDGGTGTMDWSTIVASVDYEAGRDWFSWDSGVLATGPRLYNVRSRSAAGVYSLVPKLGDKMLGSDTLYGPVGGRNAVQVILATTAPATPAAPLFA